MKKFLSLLALVGASGVGVAEAVPVYAQLVSVGSYSKSSTTISNWTAVGTQTAAWTFDESTNTLAMTGGTYKRVLKSGGGASVMTHTMSGVTIGSGVATGGSWSCTEGTFGEAVGAHICGNYLFGDDYTNDSVYTPVGTGATVALGGDDAALPGGPQTLANNYSYMRATRIGGWSSGLQSWELTNGQNLYAGFGETVTGYDTGYKFVIEFAACAWDGSCTDIPGCYSSPTCTPPTVTPIPPAVWLFGSALGLMGVMRRKITG